MKYDFDNAAPDRRGSGSYKWDSQPPFPCGDASLIPMWVADMDFRTAPCVIDALRRRVEHGVFDIHLFLMIIMLLSMPGFAVAMVMELIRH